MTEPKPLDRKAKHRILNSAGFVHASGWIAKRDLATFQHMVAWSRDEVAEVIASAEAKRFPQQGAAT